MSAELLAKAVPRSECDPDHVATGSAAMHPFTGTFTDPAHESAFAAQAFRKAYPAHLVMLGLILSSFIFIALTEPPDAFTVNVWWQVHEFTVMVALVVALGLTGRVVLHRMTDAVRSRRMGSWTWTATVFLGGVSLIIGCLFDRVAACATLSDFVYPILTLAVALTNGSYGMSFAHQFALACFPLAFLLVKLTVCFSDRALALATCEIGALVVGFFAAHVAQLYLRHLYAAEQRLEEEKRRLGVRNEQLQAEKERLVYDMQRRGHPIDDDNRSAIRRGLQAGRGPSGSPPPSLPPGAPSSTDGSSSAATPHAGAGSDSLGAGATPLVSESGSMSDVEEVMTDILGDEEAFQEVLRTQRTLSSPPAPQAKPKNAADEAVAWPRVVVHKVQEIDSKPEGQCGKRRQELDLPAVPPVGPPPVAYSHGPLPGSPDHEQNSRIARQRAVHMTRQLMLAARTETETLKIVRALAQALGAVRTESGTIKAVHAVLLLLDRPEMSEKEAYTLTGASMSNFKKWRKRIRHAQLGLPPAP
jgi:hypothetical protein